MRVGASLSFERVTQIGCASDRDCSFGGCFCDRGSSMTLKVSFAGAALCVALTSFAQAADMQPVLKAPGAQPEQQATGYVEVYSGWASTRDSSNFSCDGCG